MIIIIFALIIVLAIISFTALLHISKLQQQVNLLDKEQHIQNKEIIELMQANTQYGEMLMQHIEILKYLVEQDPQLGRMRIPYGGVIGEA
jgi:Na+-transporting NADH:ubiquinone oxidoreductase subunit NqrC